MRSVRGQVKVKAGAKAKTKPTAKNKVREREFDFQFSVLPADEILEAGNGKMFFSSAGEYPFRVYFESIF